MPRTTYMRWCVACQRTFGPVTDSFSLCILPSGGRCEQERIKLAGYVANAIRADLGDARLCCCNGEAGQVNTTLDERCHQALQLRMPVIRKDQGAQRFFMASPERRITNFLQKGTIVLFLCACNPLLLQALENRSGLLP